MRDSTGQQAQALHLLGLQHRAFEAPALGLRAPLIGDIVIETDHGELAVVVRAGQWEAFRQAVAGLGLLLDVEVSSDQ